MAIIERSKSHSQRFIEFRPDVEGLRAIAVLLVIVFHMGLPSLQGGYVGVDIFFVLSGFLITQDIVNRIDAGKFSVVEFYLRRIRRIFPAMFVMLILSVFVGFFLLYPAEFEGFAKSAISAALSASNIFFFRKDSYFADTADQAPLLHTWSLGVEEQFYMVWPVLIIVCVRLFGRRSLVPVFVILTVASLALSEWLLAKYPTFAFFMLPSRAWELSLGGTIGLLLDRFQTRWNWASAVGIAGLSAIAYSTIWYSAQTPFPGFAAAVPCLGVAALLVSGRAENFVSRALSIGPLAHVGRLSYSLYLAHWPVLVFWGMMSPETSVWIKLAQALTIYATSVLIYKTAEVPFRKFSTAFNTYPRWLGAAALAIILICAPSAYIIVKNGLPDRKRAPDWIALASRESTSFQANPCLVRGAELPLSEVCIPKASNNQGTIVLWGDSHAAQAEPAIRQAAKELSLRAVILTKAGCAPFPGLVQLPPNEMRSACEKFNEAALKEILSIKDLKAVVLAAHWEVFLSGEGRISKTDQLPAIVDSDRLIAESLAETEAELQRLGAKTLLMGVAPIGHGSQFSCAVRAAYFGRNNDACSAGLFEETEVYQTKLLAVAGHVPVVNYISLLCKESTCRLFEGSFYGLLDNNHLSRLAAMKTVSSLVDLIR